MDETLIEQRRLDAQERKAALTDQKKEKRIPLVEAFGPTIQGEGYMVGVRTTFLRFGLCDYKCVMCDSMHAVDPLQVKANATWLTQAEILDRLLEVQQSKQDPYILNAEWVTFSGGNPCMHDLSELIQHIRGLDATHGQIKIAVETQGTLLPEWLHYCDVVTVSPKSPGMGEKFEQDKFMRFLMAFKYHKGFNVKVVVFSMQDIEFAKHINSLMIEEGLGDRMYLSLGNPFPPGLTKIEGEDGHITDDDLRIRLLNDYRILTEDLLQEPWMRNVKFLPQLHVLTWANKQGV